MDLTYAQQMGTIHKPFRRELAALPALVRAVPEGDRRRAGTVAAWVSDVLRFLTSHHEGEDDLLWPVLKDRVHADDQAMALVARMEAQHDGLHEALEGAKAATARWRDGAAAADRDAVADALDAMRPVVVEHLDAEESELCPLAQRHLTQREWDRLSEHGRRAVPGRAGRDLFGAILEDATPAERSWLESEVPPPVRWILIPVVERGYRRRMADVRAG